MHRDPQVRKETPSCEKETAQPFGSGKRTAKGEGFGAFPVLELRGSISKCNSKIKEVLTIT